MLSGARDGVGELLTWFDLCLGAFSRIAKACVLDEWFSGADQLSWMMKKSRFKRLVPHLRYQIGKDVVCPFGISLLIQSGRISC